MKFSALKCAVKQQNLLKHRNLRMCSLTVIIKARRFRATIDHDRHSIPQFAWTNLAKFTVPYSLNTARAPEAEGSTQLAALPGISHNNRQNLPRSIHHNFFLQMCSLWSPQWPPSASLTNQHSAHVRSYHSLNSISKLHCCRFQWPRGLRRSYAASCLLRLRVRNPLEAWMSVVCVACY